VQWERDLSEFVKNALSPAKVLYVVTDEDEKVAHTVVPDDQLSLAIGKEGQNARLAARLTGWRIDIKSETQADELGLYEQFIREPELPEEGLELEEAELELEPDLMDAEEAEVEVIAEAEPEEAEEMPEPAVKEEPKAPAVQPPQ